MAIRRHIAAAWDVSLEEFERVFSEAFGERMTAGAATQDGRWTYLMASVWGTSGAELDAALQKLSAPTLRITTEDATRWYLLLFGPGHEPVTVCHEFGYLYRAEISEEDEPDELEKALAVLEQEDESERESTKHFDAIAEDFSFLGCPLPAEQLQRWREMPLAQATAALLHWQAEMVCDALERLEIPHECAAIHAVLAGSAATETELDWDIGNLPRFLVALGFGGQWREMVERAENPESFPEEESEQITDEPEEGPADVVTPLLEKFREQTDSASPAPLGGAIAWPAREVEAIRRIADFCGESPELILIAENERGFDLEKLRTVTALALCEISSDADFLRRIAWIVDKDNDGAADDSPLSQLLHALPPETTLEAVTVELFVYGSSSYGNHRYRGALDGDTWHIEAAFPAVEKLALENALTLAREVEQQEKTEQAEIALIARDEREADAIMNAAAHSINFESDPPRRNGLQIAADQWQLDDLAALFFRERFREDWDVSAAEAAELQQWRESQRFLQSVRAPHSEKIVWQGAAAVFYHADIRDLRELDREELEAAEAFMLEQKFQPLGDIVCDAVDQVTLRGYAASDGRMFGTHMQTMEGDAYTEFYTLFENDDSLTTTANDSVSAHPEHGIYTVIPDQDELHELFQRQQRGIEKFRAHKNTAPRAITPTLKGLAQAVDEFLQREAKATQGMMRMISFSIPLDDADETENELDS